MSNARNLFKKKNIGKIVEISMYAVTIMALFCTYINSKWNMDIAWFYSFSRYMKEGLVPYRDYTMVTTPFAAWLLSLPLYIKDSFMAWNIISFIVHITEMFMVALICKKNNMSSFFTAIITCFTGLTAFVTCVGYNNIATIITFIMIYICMNNKYKTKNIIFLGVLSSLCIMTKQSTGVYISFAAIICLFIFSKNKIKTTFIYGISGILTALPFLVYLVRTKALNDALDIWFGCTTFKIIDSEKSLLVVYGLILVSIAIFILQAGIRKKDKNTVVMGIFSIINCMLLYPLPNTAHILYATVVLLVASLNYLLKNIKNLTQVAMIISVFPAIIILFQYMPNEGVSGENQHLNTQIEEHLGLVNNYIYSDPEHSYIFIDNNSTYAHLLHDKANGNKEVTVFKWFDVMLEGNIGSNNAKEIAANADCDYFIVVADKDEFFWQYSDELKEYLYSLPLEKYIDCDNGHAYAVYKHKAE